MTIDDAITEWLSKKRISGCNTATRFLCRRVKGFTAERLTRYTKDGEVFQHVVASNGKIRIDLAPHTDRPD